MLFFDIKCRTTTFLQSKFTLKQSKNKRKAKKKCKKQSTSQKYTKIWLKLFPRVENHNLTYRFTNLL